MTTFRFFYLIGLFILSSACAKKGPGADIKPAEGAISASTSVTMPEKMTGCPDEGQYELIASDINEDGHPDNCKYYQSSIDETTGETNRRLIRQALDVNWDRKFDIQRTFDADGNVTLEEWDTDYDLQVDERRYYKNGLIVRSERDQDNDGRADTIRYYTDGKLQRKEIDSNSDGQVDRWEYFKGRAIERIGIDSDFDGKVDRWAKAKANSDES